MPIALDTPKYVSKTVEKFEVTAFSINIERNEGYIAYDEQDAAGVTLGEDALVVEGQALIDVITRASMLVGGDVYTAIKTAMLEAVATAEGVTGTFE